MAEARAPRSMSAKVGESRRKWMVWGRGQYRRFVLCEVFVEAFADMMLLRGLEAWRMRRSDSSSA